jgi:hypothetical protein
MLVRDQDTMERFRRDPANTKAPANLTTGETGIDQQAGAGRGYDRAIALTAAGENCERDTHMGSISGVPVYLE